MSRTKALRAVVHTSLTEVSSPEFPKALRLVYVATCRHAVTVDKCLMNRAFPLDHPGGGQQPGGKGPYSGRD